MSIAIVVAAALAATTTAVAASGAAARADSGPTAGGAVAILAGSTAPFAVPGDAMGAVPAGNRLTIQFWLKSHTAAAESYASAVSTPGSRLFERYLTPAAYTARFGATAREAASVESWLTSAGFSGVSADSGRDYVSGTAPVSAIDSALTTRLLYYRPTAGINAGGYQLRANDRAVSLPKAVAASVLGVTGLENAAPVKTYDTPKIAVAPGAMSGKPISFPCSSWYAQHYVRRTLPRQFGTTSFPTIVCGYSADQLRAAYGYNRHNIGKGVTIALVEIGLAPGMFENLQDYARVNRIESPSASRYAELSLGRGSACGDEFNIEEQLDVESSYDMAPLANQLVIGGDSCNNGFYGLQALFDADTAILNGAGGHPLARIASNSWEGNDEAQPLNLVNIEHAYLLRAAAEGVSMLFSAGDGSGVLTPSSDPYATAVGGTTLGIGRKDPRLFETGWSTGVEFDVKNRWISQGEAYASGGGPSLLWAQPRYQRGVVPNSLAKAPGNRAGLVRALPDLSADGDPSTGMGVGLLSFNVKGAVNGFYEQSIGGTSLAAPLVAGLVADAEQYQRPFGFLNGGLYRLAGTRAVTDALPITGTSPSRYRGVACDVADCGVLSYFPFDVQSWSMAGYTGQVSRQGYDTMTGVGSPNGQNFIYTLRRIFG
ncbi:MAG TPA: protease pro-enzyme activation domain-containing protein [Trebonia sp.]|nr:protease pro-enzyme activation domain-containing protein [Trebonia sp.]